MTNILEVVQNEVYGVWYLVGAALVFFMQCGFAMVETGFTRAKNAGNIIMKNLMDFCIGTPMFLLLGFSLMLSEDYVMGLIGVPNLGIFTDYANFDWSNFVFNLVFLCYCGYYCFRRNGRKNKVQRLLRIQRGYQCCHLSD